jgi:hypothetical protein
MSDSKIFSNLPIMLMAPLSQIEIAETINRQLLAAHPFLDQYGEGTKVIVDAVSIAVSDMEHRVADHINNLALAIGSLDPKLEQQKTELSPGRTNGPWKMT